MTDQKISLKDLQDLLTNKSKYLLNTEKGHQGISGYDDRRQGEYNETFRFYKHPGLPEGMFMRETYNTDSYGGNNHLVDVHFVQGKAKQITVYEPIS